MLRGVPGRSFDDSDEAAGLGSRAAFGIASSIVVTGIRTLIQIGTLAILARQLTHNDFGVFGLTIIVVGLVAIIAQMGIPPALVYYERIDERDLAAASAACIGLGILAWLAISFTAPVAAWLLREDALSAVLPVAGSLVAIDATAHVARSCLQRDLRFEIVAVIDLVTYACAYSLVAIWLAHEGAGVWSLVLATLSLAFARSAVFNMVGGLIWPRFDVKRTRKLLKYGKAEAVARLGNFFAVQGDNFVIGRFLGAAALGVYGRAYGVVSVPASVIGQVVQDVLFPTFSRAYDRQSQQFYRASIGAVLLGVLPVGVAVAIVAPEIVLVVLGPDWADVVPPLRVLALVMVFRVGYKVSDALAQATGTMAGRARRQFVYAAAVVGAACAGLPWGLVGSATGVAFAIVVNYLLMMQLVRRIVQISWRELVRIHVVALPPTVITAVALGVVVVLMRSGHMGPWLTIMATCLISAIVVCSSFAVLSPFGLGHLPQSGD